MCVGIGESLPPGCCVSVFVQPIRNVREGHPSLISQVDYLGGDFVLVDRVRSSTQTGSPYCKSKPKVGGRIKDPMCEAFRHGRVDLVLPVYKSYKRIEIMSEDKKSTKSSNFMLWFVIIFMMFMYWWFLNR